MKSLNHSSLLAFLILILMFSAKEGWCQDPNLSTIEDFSNYEVQYDSVNNYYQYVQYNYNDNYFGVSIYSYHGPDTLMGYTDYMTLAPLEDGQNLYKGISYELNQYGTFISIGRNDWSGLPHGNRINFHPDGAIKSNEIWDRGKLIKSWKYSESGELIEYKEYE